MNLLSKLKNALFKTNKLFTQEENQDLLKIDEDFFDLLFEKLIRSDAGFDFSEEIIKRLKLKLDKNEITKKHLKEKFKEIVFEIINLKNPPNVESKTFKLILFCGVNGSGKTTSIAKLAYKLKETSKVLIIAGDTFRAAASDQLSVWAKRVNVDLYSPSDIKKPDAVVFSGIEKAKNENYDVVLVDTAGRLQSQKNLMDELKKINDVILKKYSVSEVEKLIVLDATIGQNAINQAEEFSKAINLDGIFLSKLDSSAKGGVILNIMHKLSIPVKFIGTGERENDLVEFNFEEYLDGLIN